MKDCKPCQPKYIPGVKRIPRCGPVCSATVNPASAPAPTPCTCKPDKITLRTVVIPPSLGTDATGEPYAPKPGAYYDAVVVYQANGAIYIYDSNGVFTEIELPNEGNVEDQLEVIRQQLTELYQPAKIGAYVDSEEELNNLSSSAITTDEMVLFSKDPAHNNEDSLYYWNASSGSWTYAYEASPYYTKEFVDEVTTSLQTNINQIFNKEAADVENLQSNINNLNERIDDIVNSPDVRYIKDTYADLEAIPKDTIGDQDYARVLQDETHENASTYYQFSKNSQEWNYVGQTGPYYTKEQVDEKLGEIDTTKLNDLADIKAIGQNLELTSDGTLNATGGGGGGGGVDNSEYIVAGDSNHPLWSDLAFVANPESGYLKFPIYYPGQNLWSGYELGFPTASTTQVGLMTARDKTKLDALPQVARLCDFGTNAAPSAYGTQTSLNLLSYYNTSYTPKGGDIIVYLFEATWNTSSQEPGDGRTLVLDIGGYLTHVNFQQTGGISTYREDVVAFRVVRNSWNTDLLNVQFYDLATQQYGPIGSDVMLTARAVLVIKTN